MRSTQAFCLGDRGAVTTWLDSHRLNTITEGLTL